MGGKRKSLDMKTRQEIVNMLQKKSGTAADLAAKYGVAVSTITRIWRKRDEIERYLRTNQDEQRKRIKFAKHRDIEEAVSSWFAEMRERNADVNGVLIKKKAKEFAEKLNVPFKASNGWLQRWKCRNGFGKKEPEQLPTEEVVRDPEELENDLISKKNAYEAIGVLREYLRQNDLDESHLNAVEDQFLHTCVTQADSLPRHFLDHVSNVGTSN